MSDLRLPYDLITLDNGLRVIVHEDHRAPLVCVNVWYHVGSKEETPGRTGFAHLFEHLMFTGSEHVPEGRFDVLLEEIGATNNGSTSTDRTNYWELLPSNGLELALWLEADRMGGLLPAITGAQLEAQRDVVRNERRQSYENRPYGLASETLLEGLYPDGHPYSWPVIGSMADIGAATLDDVHAFCRQYYTPNNAAIAVAGNVTPAQVQEVIERYFADIPRGPDVQRPSPAPPPRTAQRIVMEDDVSLARLYIAWHSPAVFKDGDAALDTAATILAHGRASRLYRSLVYEKQLAQSVSAYQSSAVLGSTFRIIVTARPGVSLAEIEPIVRRELEAMSNEVAERELERALNGIETGFVDSLQNVGGFGGRADQLNMYLFHTGEPDYAAQDLCRYLDLTTADVTRSVREHLLAPSVVLSVVPLGRSELAAEER
ncbi:MAG TPA: pitrilysin family protein [Longimicrobiales bacterium]|nr:pitrilysin family protein [Longimicrobiales bacterium]